MIKQVYYFANYCNQGCTRNLCTQPSVIGKSSYIIQALKESGSNVFVFSTAEGDISHGKFYVSDSVTIDEKEMIYYPYSVGRSNIILKVISRVLLYIQMIFFIIFKLNRNSIILVYHSLVLKFPLNVIRIFFRRNIFFEVEEIYNACYRNTLKIDNEVQYLSKASGYILVNDIIKEKCNFKKKSITCYGSYIYNNAAVSSERKFSKINLLYAGLIDSYGSDVYLAVDIAKFLPENYHIYILGYGTDKNVSNIIKYIENNKISNRCSVSYEGCLSGEEYIKFLEKCDIGLCSRVLDDNLSDYTFPSKVLVYLCNNIIPICTPLTCIQESEIRKYVRFSESCSAESLSETILNTDLSIKNEYKELVTRLHKNFINRISELLWD